LGLSIQLPGRVPAFYPRHSDSLAAAQGLARRDSFLEAKRSPDKTLRGRTLSPPFDRTFGLRRDRRRHMIVAAPTKWSANMEITAPTNHCLKTVFWNGVDEFLAAISRIRWLTRSRPASAKSPASYSSFSAGRGPAFDSRSRHGFTANIRSCGAKDTFPLTHCFLTFFRLPREGERPPAAAGEDPGGAEKAHCYKAVI
jgi:hypothetical protein